MYKIKFFFKEIVDIGFIIDSPYIEDKAEFFALSDPLWFAFKDRVVIIQSSDTERFYFSRRDVTVKVLCGNF